MSTKQKTEDQMISVSATTLEYIINRLRWDMYDNWDRANTMMSEYEYYKTWYRKELDIIESLQKSLYSGE